MNSSLPKVLKIEDRVVKMGLKERVALEFTYSRNDILNDVEARISFLRTRLGYSHYACYSGKPTPARHLKALERAFIIEKC